MASYILRHSRHPNRRGRFGTWRPASGGRGGPDAARTCPGRAPDAAGPVPDGRRTPPDAAGRKLKSRRTGAGRAPDAAGRRRTQVEVSRTPPDARPKTTIGLGAPVEVFIYYLWPPAVVCHRGPPSTTRARVDRRTVHRSKLRFYWPGFKSQHFC